MGNITWTKSWSASDNGTVLGGADLQNLQNDITTVVNGGITNANIASGAAIVESKVAFSTSGHTHNGTDSNYPLIKHYRRGMTLKQGTDNEDIVVTPGVLDIGGTLIVSTADSSNIDIVSGTYADSGSRPTNGPIYVYAYMDTTLKFALSTEPPDLSDASDNTAEFPLRYQKYGTTYYRLVGIAHTDTDAADLYPDMYNNFDASTFACGSLISQGADVTVVTGWSPDLIKWVICADASPANGETLDIMGMVQRYGFNKTGDANPDALYYDWKGNTHITSANGTANTLYNVNEQSTSQPGSFTIDVPTDTQVFMWMAWTKGDSGIQAS